MFAHGEGLEIGALHNPWPVPKEASVKNLDRYTVAELRAQYPELAEKHIVETDIVDDGQYLRNVPDGALDFVLNSHVLEHCENPLQTLKDWLRVLKVGGCLVMAIPEKTQTFDANRPLTTFEECLEVFTRSETVPDRKKRIYREWIANRDGLTGEEAEAKFKRMVENNEHIHFQVWTKKTLTSFFLLAEELFESCFELELMEMVGIEVFVVLRKVK